MSGKIKRTVSAEWFLIKTMFQTAPALGALYWIVVSVDYSIPLINIWLWKQILDMLVQIQQSKNLVNSLWLALGVYLFLQILSALLKKVISITFSAVSRRASRELDGRIMQKIAETEFSYFDNPDNRDTVSAVQNSGIYVTGNMPWAISTLIQVIAFVAGLTMFLSYNWFFGILFIITYIPGAVFSYRYNKKVDEWSLDEIPETRRKDYYKSLLTQGYAAKEIRLYNLASHYKDKYNELWAKIRKEREKLFIDGTVQIFLSSLVTYIGIVVVICCSVYAVMRGEMLIGTLALYVGLAQSTGENFKHILSDLLCQVEIDVPRINMVRDFLDEDHEIVGKAQYDADDCPMIEFRDVSFRYPGNDDLTLNKLSFQINSGKKVALVGVNGAGKTTVVKLLLRFYKPTSGYILINGRDIQEYEAGELYKIISPCFQTVSRYALTVRENIALSDVSRSSEIGEILSAAQASGADQFIRSLSDGYETELTRQFSENGAELSGGQWQKIALARAFFKKSKFVILDEPSSALDPEAEDYIFSSFYSLCKDKGGVLISHRLSSIMLVDEILVMENGRIIESGTHNELMERHGRYAEMYRLQASKYTRGECNE